MGFARKLAKHQMTKDLLFLWPRFALCFALRARRPLAVALATLKLCRNQNQEEPNGQSK